MKAIVIVNSCWPYSGRQYGVLVNGTSVLQTNDLDEANQKAKDINK